MSKPKKIVRAAVIALTFGLILGAIYQVGAALWRSIEPAQQVWRAIGKSGMWRGVNFSVGQEFANYLEYLNEVIPEDAQVILPPDGIGPPAISRTPYMQFFLAPRQVVNCTGQSAADLAATGTQPGEDCAIQAANAGAYVLVVQEDDYPAVLVRDKNRLHLFDQNLGVYFPAGAAFVQTPSSGNSSLMQIAWKLIWPGVWVLALSWAGLMMVSWLAPDWRSAGRAALGFGLGVGGPTLLLYAALLLGIRLSRTLLIGISLAWVCAGLLVYILSWRSQARWVDGADEGVRDKNETGRFSWSEIIYFLLFAGLAGLAAVLAVGMGFHWGDEVILWGVKGYGIASLGLSAGVSEWGTRTTSYPLNIPLWIASFRAGPGDFLPESKILFPLFYFSQLLLVYDFLRDLLPDRRGVHLAAWLTLAYASTPLIFTHATWAYANLPLTFYLSGAVIAAGRAINSIGRGKKATRTWRRGLLLSGIFFMLAAWTRPEGLSLSALAVLCSAWFFLRRAEKSQRLGGLAALAGPLAVFSMFWWMTSPMVYQQGGWSDAKIGAGLTQIISGNLNLDNSLFVLRSFFGGFLELHTWGVVGLSLVLLVLLAPLVFFQQKSIQFILVTGVGLALAVLGLYILLANDPASNTSWWVDTGLDRMSMPAITLLWLGLIGWVGAWLAEIIDTSPEVLEPNVS